MRIRLDAMVAGLAIGGTLGYLIFHAATVLQSAERLLHLVA